MTKKIIIAASIACTALAMPAQDVLRVTANNGDTQDYKLEDLDRLTFSDDETSMNVVLLYGEPTVVMLSDMRYITFEDEPTAVNDITTDALIAIIDRSLLRVTASQGVRSVAIYDVQGRMQLMQQAGGAQQADVRLSDIPSGVNIVVVETTTGKVSRKFTIK